MLRATIKDDRGKTFPLAKTEFFIPGLTSNQDAERRDRLILAQNAMEGTVTKRELFEGIGLALLLSPIIIGTAQIPAMMSFKLKWPWWAMLLATIPQAAMPLILSIWFMRRVAGNRIVRLYKRAGFCPSCSYDLRTVDESTDSSDGCTVCPECGAAWRLDTAKQSKS
ncbi:MAG: hypothetical protein U0640_13875 [Phycisphaerales bacterium]